MSLLVTEITSVLVVLGLVVFVLVLFVLVVFVLVVFDCFRNNNYKSSNYHKQFQSRSQPTSKYNNDNNRETQLYSNELFSAVESKNKRYFNEIFFQDSLSTVEHPNIYPAKNTYLLI